jgi:hypothetical protein
MESFDLTADEFEITPQTLNLYQCFTFEIPVGEERFLRRIEPLVDDSRVLHHIVLFHDTSKSTPLGARRCFNIPADNLFLYTWAPGTGPIAFDDGGLRMKPGDRYTIQIHYNNGAGADRRPRQQRRAHLPRRADGHRVRDVRPRAADLPDPQRAGDHHRGRVRGGPARHPRGGDAPHARGRLRVPPGHPARRRDRGDA